MRTLAGWIALTPELAAKLLLGRQVWDCAQHADAWGKRLPELRAPAQVSEPPNDAFVRFMDALEDRQGPDETIERLAGVYRVLKPHLVATYGHHLARANPVYEPPTRRILARCIDDEERHIVEATAVLESLVRDERASRRMAGWVATLERLLSAAGGVTGEGDPGPRPADGESAPGAPRPITGSAGPGGLAPAPIPGAGEAEPVERAAQAHANRVLAGDPGASGDLAPGARLDPPDLLDRLLRTQFASASLVAHARIGGHHIVKTRFEGPTSLVIQARWVEQALGRWQVVEMDVARLDREGNGS